MSSLTMSFVYFQGGYRIRLAKIESCGDFEQVVRADENITVSLSRNCEFSMVGCGETIVGFNTAMASSLQFVGTNIRS